jgi:hypothetical protein
MIEAASVPIAFAPQQAVVVVRTPQSFEDLAAALEDRGYEREDEVLVYRWSGSGSPFTLCSSPSQAASTAAPDRGQASSTSGRRCGSASQW